MAPLLNYNHVTRMVPTKYGVDFYVVGALDRCSQNGDGEDILNFINKKLDEIGSVNFQGQTMLIDLEDLYE